jgi:hypothetical protein
MNAVIAQYAVDRPASERVVLIDLWREIEKEVVEKDDERLHGKLPNFGRVALEFIREMKEHGITADPTWRERQRRSYRVGIPQQNIYR